MQVNERLYNLNPVFRVCYKITLSTRLRITHPMVLTVPGRLYLERVTIDHKLAKR